MLDVTDPQALPFFPEAPRTSSEAQTYTTLFDLPGLNVVGDFIKRLVQPNPPTQPKRKTQTPDLSLIFCVFYRFLYILKTKQFFSPFFATFFVVWMN